MKQKYFPIGFFHVFFQHNKNDFVSKYNVQVSNTGGQRAVGIQAKSSNSRLSVNPAGELLQAGQSSTIAITCKPFNPVGDTVGNDTVTIEWANAPNDVKQFNAAALFPASAAKKNKVITIE